MDGEIRLGPASGLPMLYWTRENPCPQVSQEDKSFIEDVKAKKYPAEEESY